MTDPLLPPTLPLATASRIAGLSPATFRTRLVETGTVRMDGGRVVLASLAAHLGRTITAADYLQADRARDRARGYQRSYRGKQNL
jgi:hypothetical protein